MQDKFNGGKTMIEPVCSECKEDCLPQEGNAGIHDDDWDYYYESDCCEADVLVGGEHMTKKQYEEWCWDTYGGY